MHDPCLGISTAASALANRVVSLAEWESYTRVLDVTNVTKRAALPQEDGITIKAVCL